MCLYVCPEANKPHSNPYGGFLCGDCPHIEPHPHVEKCDILCWTEDDYCRPVLSEPVQPKIAGNFLDVLYMRILTLSHDLTQNPIDNSLKNADKRNQQ